ncbi:MAG: hypothetical protein HRU03_04290 [Nanoarchaeales archaeon]|nr:hypothetical protein [Nanoarchaeales archaeon]
MENLYKTMKTGFNNLQESYKLGRKNTNDRDIFYKSNTYSDNLNLECTATLGEIFLVGEDIYTNFNPSNKSQKSTLEFLAFGLGRIMDIDKFISNSLKR